MKRVVVTGTAGFIGRRCLEPLHARGFEVHALRHSRDNTGDATWHDVDLLSAADTAHAIRAIAPTHLLHLAWYAVPGKYWTARDNLAWVRASLALHEAFVAAGGKRAVFAGSCAEYAWTGTPSVEATTPLSPKTYYGRCKRALSDVVLGDASASVAWARFFFLFGEHEYPERLVPSVVRALLRGERARCSPGTQVRDFMHVADAADAVVALLDSDVTGAVNIGSGEPIAVRDLVEKCRTMIGGDVDLGALAADPDPFVVADVHRLRDEVGWTPTIDLDARLCDTIEWWRGRSDDA